MPNAKRTHLVLPPDPERQRALGLIKRVLEDIKDSANMKDISEYEASDEFTWRHWPALSTGIVTEPLSAWTIFKDESESEITILVQSNHDTGAIWTEIPMLSLAIMFLRAWNQRLRENDADELFKIPDELTRENLIDEFTARQIRQLILLFTMTTQELLASVVHDSRSGFINQIIKPHFEKHWRSLAIPRQFRLFPALDEEARKLQRQSQALKKAWLDQKHGGRRNVRSLADQPRFMSIISFIELIRPFWAFAIRYFAKHDYDSDCVHTIKLDKAYEELSRGFDIPDRGTAGLPSPRSFGRCRSIRRHRPATGASGPATSDGSPCRRPTGRTRHRSFGRCRSVRGSGPAA